MSGMLIKEFAYLKGQNRAFFAVLILSMVFFILMISQSRHLSAPERSILLALSLGVMMAMLVVVLIMNSLGADEKSKWNSYARSLPIGAARIVGAKYVFLLILTASGMVLGMLFYWIAMGFHADCNALFTLCSAAGGISLLVCSIELPLALQFSLQKTNFVVILVCCFGPALSSRFSGGDGAMPADTQVPAILRLVPVIAPAVLWLYRF